MSSYHPLTEKIIHRHGESYDDIVPDFSDMDEIIREWLKEKAVELNAMEFSVDKILSLNQPTLEEKFYEAKRIAFKENVTDYIPIYAQIAKKHYEDSEGDVYLK